METTQSRSGPIEKIQLGDIDLVLGPRPLAHLYFVFNQSALAKQWIVPLILRPLSVFELCNANLATFRPPSCPP